MQINGFWGAYAILGFFASVATHLAILSGVVVPHQVILYLALAIFPVFIVAILLHPRMKPHFIGAHVDGDDLQNIPRWVHGVIWGAAIYLVVLWLQVPSLHFSLMKDLDHPHQKIASWFPTIFFAAAFAMRWSARRYASFNIGP